MKRRGAGRVYQRGQVWWIAYQNNGTTIRESSNSTKKTTASDLLNQRLAGLGRPREEAAVTVADLRARHEADFALQERRSTKRLGQLWAHIEDHFGKKRPAIEIKTAQLDGYVKARLDGGAARNTIKNELNALRRAFRLSQKSAGGTLHANDVPVFPKIKASDPRKGFFERDEHERVRAALPPDQGDLAEFLFWTGWRVSEAEALQWQHVDEAAGVLRIETSKTNEPRTLPYAALPALVDLVNHRREVTDAVQKKRGVIVTHVFHRNGDPIRHFRRSWKTACVAAGLGKEIRHPDVLDAKGNVVERGKLIRKEVYRIPHDYRRSAARNLSRAGVPEAVIMRLCGWKTRSVFDRYRIVAERDLAEGLEKLAAAPPTAAGKVAPMRERR